ncbi:actin patch protein 1 [Hypomontagnella submonticulosa]|nr:actin patch protein 1 [Hypomontagnella submonticulosa]
MTSMPGYGVGSGSYDAEGGRERGARRRKLAAMASTMYRASATAVNEIKESYYQTRSADFDTSDAFKVTIPGSFPDVAIVTKGNEQMVLFPSYAKMHVKEQPRQYENPAGPPPSSAVGMKEQEYWTTRWSQLEDEKSVVDVDVRGWIYNPHRGPMTRRNRILLGIARQLSGIPPPRAQQTDPSTADDPSLARMHQQHEEERERERIAREAKEIERRGRAEEEAAQKGKYSERPRDEDSEGEGDRLRPDEQLQPGARSPPSAPSSPTLRGRTGTTGGTELTDAELAVANANLMARIAPFMTTPIVDLAITIFFYNDDCSQSRTVRTDDSGHFMIRAALNFIPTHVRVLANENLSCTEPVQIIEPKGVSLISDIDDTIKRSSISLGTKEIFRNTFVRELHDLTIDGVKEWYNTLDSLGVRIHYCSNSPWQLYPVLATYLKLAGLPPGSLHLKRYAGMLQGIFEPVAERKKGTLEKIMKDFPERRFLLVGDSGEADLEVYTELVITNPGRIVAIFIRDVTTPEQTGYFDSGFDARSNKGRISRTNSSIGLDQRASEGSYNADRNDKPSGRPQLPPRVVSSPKPISEPVMGDLIDLSDGPGPLRRVGTEPKPIAGQRTKSIDLLGRKQPPPRPAKPSSLQGRPAAPVLTTGDGASGTTIGKKSPTPMPPQRRETRQTSSDNSSSTSGKAIAPSPLGPTQRSADQVRIDGSQQFSLPFGLTKVRIPGQSPSDPTLVNVGTKSGPPPPPPRRRFTPSGTTTRSSPNLAATPSNNFGFSRRRTGGSEGGFEPLPPAANPGGQSTYSSGSGSASPTADSRKLDLWRRRLQRAQETLDRHGVALYTWRRGDEVVDEAVGIVRACLKDMGVRQ